MEFDYGIWILWSSLSFCAVMCLWFCWIWTWLVAGGINFVPCCFELSCSDWNFVVFGAGQFLMGSCWVFGWVWDYCVVWFGLVLKGCLFIICFMNWMLQMNWLRKLISSDLVRNGKARLSHTQTKVLDFHPHEFSYFNFLIAGLIVGCLHEIKWLWLCHFCWSLFVGGSCITI